MAGSAVLTQPSRIFLPIAGAALLLAVAFGFFTGDWLGTSLYLLLFGVAGFAGTVVAGFRINDTPERVPADAPPPGRYDVPRVPLPAGGAWPFLAALSTGLLLLGFVVGPLAAFFGIGLAVATTTGWLARVSADTTGREINLLPVGLPVVGLFCIGAVMFFLSRVLLAVSEMSATWIALAVALVILGMASLFALRPAISGQTMLAVLALAGVAMVGGGLLAAAAGERHIEHHGGEGAHGGEGGHGSASAEISAADIAFDTQELSFPANTEVELVFHNDDEGIPHNVAIYEGEDATAPPLLKGAIINGTAEITYQFTTPGPGTYYFQCDVHPNMNGEAHVE